MNRSTRRWSVWLHRVIPAVAIVVFLVAIVFIVRMFRHYSAEQILSSMEAIPRLDLVAAIAVTAFSYLVLSTYDLMGLRYVGSKLSVRPALFSGFTAFAFGNNIGLASVAGSSIRLRLYTSFGLSPGEVVRVIAFVSLTFWVGYFTIAGLSTLMLPVSLPDGFYLSQSTVTLIGSLFLAIAAAYIGLCRTFRRPIFFRGQILKLPHPGLALAQALTAAFDWMLAAAVLYLLLPHDQIGYFQFLSIFVSAQTISLASHVPGGVGILEALIVYFMSSDHEPSPEILGGLLAYRLIYYISPLIVAAIFLVTHEVMRKRRVQPETKILARAEPFES